MALADEDSPVFMLGGFQVAGAAVADEPQVADGFRTGEGVGWHEHDARLFDGTERFFRPGYRGNLIDGLDPRARRRQAKLEAGAKVADIGCGHGASTIIMAQAFPDSKFFGFDYHDRSIEAAREARRARPASPTA